MASTHDSVSDEHRSKDQGQDYSEGQDQRQDQGQDQHQDHHQNQNQDQDGGFISNPETPLLETMQWMTLAHPSSASVAQTVIISNMDTLSVQMQKLTELVLSLHLKLDQQKSRRSSVGSGSRRSPMSGTNEKEPDDGSAIAYNELQGDDEQDALYQCFKDFTRRPGKRPLLSRSKNINAFSKDFMEEIPNVLSQFIDEEKAASMISNLSKLNDECAIDMYIAFSNRAKKSAGKQKSVVTRTSSFQTDVQGESQSTQGPSTPPETTQLDRTTEAMKTPYRSLRNRQIITKEDEDDEIDGDD